MASVGWDLLRAYETRDDSLTLRRFMDFSKFEHLINTETLFFAPASFFEDTLEGHYTSRNYKALEKQLIDCGFDAKSLERAEKAKSLIARHNQSAVVISCWTTAPTFDDFMWNSYTQSTESVVVDTTVGRLRKTLGADFLIIPVRYLDFSEHEIPKDHSMKPFFYKQAKFSMEQEVRVIGEMVLGEKIGTPRKAPVDLSVLISKVTINPGATKTFEDSVHKLLQKIVWR